MFVRVSLDIYFCITFFSTDLTHKTSKRQSNTLITKGKDISNPEDIANAFIFFSSIKLYVYLTPFSVLKKYP